MILIIEYCLFFKIKKKNSGILFYLKLQKNIEMDKAKILIVDDYLDNRVLIKEIVEILGHEYIMVENGAEAVKMVEETEDINIVLMDIEMPVMNGIEATKEIRNNLPIPKCQIPIVAISAHSPEHFEEKFKIIGFNDYISKPYSLNKLLRIISKYK